MNCSVAFLYALVSEWMPKDIKSEALPGNRANDSKYNDNERIEPYSDGRYQGTTKYKTTNLMSILDNADKFRDAFGKTPGVEIVEKKKNA